MVVGHMLSAVARSYCVRALLTLACTVALVAARGAVRDWVILGVTSAQFVVAAAPIPGGGSGAAILHFAHAAAMTGVAAGVLLGGAIDAGWEALPWDAQVCVDGGAAGCTCQLHVYS